MDGVGGVGGTIEGGHGWTIRTALVKLLAREDREFQRQSIRRIVCSFSSNANRHKVCWLRSKWVKITPRGGKREPNTILAQYLNSTGLSMVRMPGTLALRRTCTGRYLACSRAGAAASDAQSASLAFY